MSTTTTDLSLADRVDALAWDGLRGQLDSRGFAVTGSLLGEAECETLSELFDDGRFRSTIDMARHRFGDGRYRYFDHPLPEPIRELRTSFYRHLAPIANAWSALLGGDEQAFPLEHAELLERCRAAGQERPTPLILRYGKGDWNALHQDLYGDVYFPFQVLTILSERPADYEGGEFVPARAASPGAESRARRRTPTRRLRRLPHPAPSSAGSTRLPQGRPASRGQHRHPRVADRARDHLPRRKLISRTRAVRRPRDMTDEHHIELEKLLSEREGPDAAAWARVRRELAERAAAEGLVDVAFERHDSPLGSIVLGATTDGLVRVGLPAEGEEAVLDELAERISARVLHSSREPVTRARRQLDEYFDGRRRSFDLLLDWQLTRGFRREVLRATARIPYGRTASYREVASEAGSPAAFRAAGSALATNPLPIIVPCHRVLPSSGGLGDYRGGAEAKAQLLSLENRA